MLALFISSCHLAGVQQVTGRHALHVPKQLLDEQDAAAAHLHVQHTGGGVLPWKLVQQPATAQLARLLAVRPTAAGAASKSQGSGQQKKKNPPILPRCTVQLLLLVGGLVGRCGGDSLDERAKEEEERVGLSPSRARRNRVATW